jgi:hypothetical protein
LGSRTSLSTNASPNAAAAETQKDLYLYIDVLALDVTEFLQAAPKGF